MTEALLVAPIIIPLVTAILCLFAFEHVVLQRLISLLGQMTLFIAGALILFQVSNDGILVTQIGNWQAPYGITLVADLFSAIMVTLAGLMGLSVIIFSFAHIDSQREHFGYYPLINILLMGVCGAFLTGDMFNLYVWFEVLLISSFVLLALGGEKRQLAGALKYVTLNLLSSMLFLTAAGILYGLVGTLNMADLSQRLHDIEQSGLTTVVAMLFLVAFGIKAGLFPLFFWLPDSYHVPPVPITTIFSALLTKVGVYALIRSFTLMFVQEVEYTHGLLLVVAGFTMVTGVLGAVAQMEFRRLLSFHIISQIGYLLMGLAIYTPLALAGTIFFMIHVILTKSALFMVSGIVYKLRGTYDLKKLGGFYRSHIWLSMLFLIAALSLAGLPPLSGFWAKFILIRAGLEAKEYWIVGVALFVSILTLFSMTKIWSEVFWKPAPSDNLHPLAPRDWLYSLVPLVSLVVMIVLMGFATEVMFDLSQRAAYQLYDYSDYVEAVLGENP